MRRWCGVTDITGYLKLIKPQLEHVNAHEMERKIQLQPSKRTSSITAVWAMLTFAYVVAWALWGLANAYLKL